MKLRKLVLGVVLTTLVALPAHAQEGAPVPEPVGRLSPPEGWEADLGRSKGLELAVGNEDHFGGVPVHVSAQHLRAPQPGGILLTTEIATVALPADPALAASAEMHGVRTGLDSLGDTVKVVRWDIKPDAAAKVTEGRLEWSDASLGTTTISRTLVFQTGGLLVRLTAECIIATDAGSLRGPCEAALETLAPLADVSKRVAVVVSQQAPPPTSLTDIQPHGDLPRGSGPTIREREGAMPVTIVVDKPTKKTDRRPYYVMAGLIVILGVYFYNRRMRQRLEGEPKPAEPAEPAKTAEPAEPEKKPADEDNA